LSSVAEKKLFMKTVCIITDTREQKNGHITGVFDSDGIMHEERKLDYGDYSFSIDGHDFSGMCVIERKANPDEIYGNITSDRERIEKELDIISDIEKSLALDPDGAAKSFGRLMAGVFVMEDDHWSPYLQKIGYGLGRYIYLADAAVDLRHDIKAGSYNPLKSISGGIESIQTPLKIMLGEASEAFEVLPLLQDIGLLRNILYSGVWIKLNQGMQKERKKVKNGK